MKIGIVGGGPKQEIPNNLSRFKDLTWIGADEGAYTLVEQGVQPTYAIGDFDSVTKDQLEKIKSAAKFVEEHAIEKDETDLELAVRLAFNLGATEIYLFGVTGGRIDHGLINIQLLHTFKEKGIRGIIVDRGNWVELKAPGHHIVECDNMYPNISFVPFTKEVTNLTLEGFYYPLENATVQWGSTLCISNKLILEKGTFSFRSGILLVIKSRDVMN